MPALGASGDRHLTQHIILHVGENLAVVLALVVMRIDINNQNVVEVALVRLLPGMREQPRGVELLDRDPPAAFNDEIHRLAPNAYWRTRRRRSSAGPALPHPEFEDRQIGGAGKT